MTPERWEKVGELYRAALERAPDKRARFLDQTCGGDADLRREVEALLIAEDSAGNFMSGDAMEHVGRMLADEHTDALIGQKLDRYQVLDLLGHGGMGEVYLAEDSHLKRKVALKLLPPYFLSRDRVARFEQEVRAISALNHPNIVTIHEVRRLDSANCIVTEFVEGHTLRELMSERRLDILQALDLTIQVAGALDAAHTAGIVHRDIKPENIMVRHDGYVKVLDFGLAKLAEQEPATTLADARTKILVRTDSGLVMGTTSYMSPEQARGEDVDERTDIWSLGVVLYEMLTGRTPFEGETSSHVIVSILEKEPQSLGEYLDGRTQEFQRIISKALRKDRNERYQSFKEVSSDLKKLKQKLERSGDTETFAVTSIQPAKTWKTAPPSSSSAEYLVNEIKRHKTAAVFACLTVVLVLGAVGYWFFLRGPTAESAAIDSLAVLPFVNVDNDPNNQFLCEGISNSIIDKLSLLPNLRVAPFNSVLRYRSQQPDPQAIGNALNVRALLIGRLTQRGDDFTISAELIDVRDNRRLWGEQYNRKVSDLVAVQSQIAQEVSEKLRLQLTGAQQQRLAKNYTDNAQAYKYYTLGDYHHRPQTKEGLIKSIEFYEQARSIDQNYALAYVGLFKAYFTLGLRGFWPPSESRYRAEWAALRAVELDDSLAAAHAVLGFAKEGLRWDWAGAEEEIQRALALNPNSFDAHFAYSSFLVHHGRADEALAYAKRAEELDPVFPMVAYVYLHQRQFEKAIDLYLQRAGKAGYRGQSQLAQAYIGAGRHAEAIAEMQNVISNVDSPERWDQRHQQR